MTVGVYASRDREDLIPLAETGFYSTIENLTAERRFLDVLNALNAKRSPLTFPPEWLARKRKNYFESKKDRMEAQELQEQLTVVYDAFPKDDRVSLLTGPPGAAKTVIATLWVKLAREHNQSLPVVLMTQERPALHRMHEKLSFQDAQLLTLDEVLDKDIAITTGAIVIIDEVGLLGTKTLATLLGKVAESDPVKIILIGDDKQLLPVEAGQPFRWLRERKKLPVHELSFPYRQKDPCLRQIVLNLYGSRIEAALEKLTIDFVTHDDLLKAAKDAINDLAPEKCLISLSGNDVTLSRLRNTCPGYRIYSLAAAQGLAVDEALLILAAPVNLSEFLVGCSRARYALRILIDQDIYADRASLMAAIAEYPKKMMALDVIDEETVRRLTAV